MLVRKGINAVSFQAYLKYDCTIVIKKDLHLIPELILQPALLKLFLFVLKWQITKSKY